MTTKTNKKNVFTIKYLVDIYLDCKRDRRLFIDQLLEKHPKLKEHRTSVEDRLTKCFVSQVNVRWAKSNSSRKRFEKTYKSWLERPYDVLKGAAPSPAPKKSGGRPKKTFEMCGARSKRQKVQEVINTLPAALILEAAKKLTPKKDRIGYEVFSASTALELIRSVRLSKRQYTKLQKAAKDIGTNIYPTYTRVYEFRKQLLKDADEAKKNKESCKEVEEGEEKVEGEMKTAEEKKEEMKKDGIKKRHIKRKTVRLKTGKKVLLKQKKILKSISSRQPQLNTTQTLNHTQPMAAVQPISCQNNQLQQIIAPSYDYNQSFNHVQPITTKPLNCIQPVAEQPLNHFQPVPSIPSNCVHTSVIQSVNHGNLNGSQTEVNGRMLNSQAPNIEFVVDWNCVSAQNQYMQTVPSTMPNNIGNSINYEHIPNNTSGFLHIN